MTNLGAVHLATYSLNVMTQTLRSVGRRPQLAPREQAVLNTTVHGITQALRAVARITQLQPERPRPPTASRVRTASRPIPPAINPVEVPTEEETIKLNEIFLEQEVRGTKTLLLEIIRRAAYDWVLYRTSTRIVQRRLAEDAYTWLFEENDHHPNWGERTRQGKAITAFVTICNELDLDADLVRAYVRKLTVKNVMSVGRPAEYRRRESNTAHIPTAAKRRPTHVATF